MQSALTAIGIRAWKCTSAEAASSPPAAACRHPRAAKLDAFAMRCTRAAIALARRFERWSSCAAGGGGSAKAIRGRRAPECPAGGLGINSSCSCSTNDADWHVSASLLRTTTTTTTAARRRASPLLTQVSATTFIPAHRTS